MPLYLFTGDEWLRRRAISKLKHKLQAQSPLPWRESLFDGEEFSLQGFIESLYTPPLFRENVLIHLRRVEKLPDPDAIVPYLERPLPPERHVILEGEKLDKRGKLYQIVMRRGEAHDYPNPDRRSLPQLAQEMLQEHGVRLPAEGLRCLLESVEGDLGRIGSEVEKLALYAEGYKMSLSDIKGLLFHDRGGDIFKALDALLERRPEAPMLLKELLERGEEPNKVFFLLAASVRALLKVKSLAAEGLSDEEIAQRVGDYPWLVAKRRRISQKLTPQEFIELLHHLHREDLHIKRGERQVEEALWALALEWMFT